MSRTFPTLLIPSLGSNLAGSDSFWPRGAHLDFAHARDAWSVLMRGMLGLCSCEGCLDCAHARDALTLRHVTCSGGGMHVTNESKVWKFSFSVRIRCSGPCMHDILCICLAVYKAPVP
jgi:hypothetical protein